MLHYCFECILQLFVVEIVKVQTSSLVEEDVRRRTHYIFVFNLGNTMVIELVPTALIQHHCRVVTSL